MWVNVTCKAGKKILTLSKKNKNKNPPVSHMHGEHIDWVLGLQPSASGSVFISGGLALGALTKGAEGRGGGGGREHLFGQAVTSLRHDATASVHQRRQLADCSVLRLVCGWCEQQDRIVTSVPKGHAADFTPETQAVVLLWAEYLSTVWCDHLLEWEFLKNGKLLILEKKKIRLILAKLLFFFLSINRFCHMFEAYYLPFNWMKFSCIS